MVNLNVKIWDERRAANFDSEKHEPINGNPFQSKFTIERKILNIEIFEKWVWGWKSFKIEIFIKWEWGGKFLTLKFLGNG